MDEHSTESRTRDCDSIPALPRVQSGAADVGPIVVAVGDSSTRAAMEQLRDRPVTIMGCADSSTALDQLFPLRRSLEHRSVYYELCASDEWTYYAAEMTRSCGGAPKRLALSRYLTIADYCAAGGQLVDAMRGATDILAEPRGGNRCEQAPARSVDERLAGAMLSARWPAYVDLLRRRNGDGYHPFPTGLPSLDAMLGGGLPRGQTTVLVAAPGTGKTSLAVDLAIQTARVDRPVVIVSLEMTFDVILSMQVSHETGLPRLAVLRGEHVDVAAALQPSMAALPIALLEQTTVAELSETVALLTERHRQPPLVIVDYAQLLADPATGADPRTAAEAVSRDLTDMTKHAECATLLLSSVSRANYTPDGAGSPKRGQALGAAKESGRWESDAGVVLGLFRCGDDEGDGGRDKRLWLLVDKNRLAGKLGVVAVQYDGLRCAFDECNPDEMPAKRAAPTAVADATAKILAAVQQDSYTNKDALASQAGGRLADARALIDRLEAEGKLYRHGTGKSRVYRIPDG